MISSEKARRRVGEERRMEVPAWRPHDGLVDAELGPEAESARRAAELFLIDPAGRRAVAVFLGRDDYEKVLTAGGLMGLVLLECLPRFVRELGGPILGELMNQLDGAAENEDLVAIATTNHLEVVERALRSRPGRFDRVLKLAGPDDLGRRSMLARLLAAADISAEDLDCAIRATRDYTGAQIEELAATIYLRAVAGEVTAGRPQVDDEPATGDGDQAASPVPVDRSLIDAALAELGVELKGRMGFGVD